MDEKDLADFFEDLVCFIDIKELIRLGYLVPVDARIISLDVNLDSWNEHRDEFAKEFVRARMQEPTSVQIQYINQLVSQNIISEELMRSATRFDASNLLSWGFYLSGMGRVNITKPSYIVSKTPYTCPKCGSAILAQQEDV